MAHDIWLKLCNTYEGSSEIKFSHRDTYNRQYQTFLRKLESHWMIVLLALSPLLALVVLLHTLIMNVLSSCYMRLMILSGV
jgi:hypothetical protein